MAKIFVSYRRLDERAFAARIRDHLAHVFGEADVFMDVENLKPGERFDTVLHTALAETDIFIAIIGPKWLDLFKADTTEERDYMRDEIGAALERGITVIPVLIDNVPLPRASDLPEDIRGMLQHQKCDITHNGFRREFDVLVGAIRGDRATREAAKAEAQPVPVPVVALLSSPAPASNRYGLIGAVAAFIVAAAGLGVYFVPRPVDVGSALPSNQPVTMSVEVQAQGELKQPGASVGEPPTAPAASLSKGPPAAPVAPAEPMKPAIAPDIAAQASIPAGPTFRDCEVVCPLMVIVPHGRFTMGSNDGDRDEAPAHAVDIPGVFAVGKYEVTFAEWDACVAGGGCRSNRRPSDQGWGRGRRPVINVSWNDANEYVSWLSGKAGTTYRLLSEAEWEYAARAGTKTRYVWGEGVAHHQALFAARFSSEVGKYPENKFGLKDMFGSVWEWCEDNWHPDYKGAPTDGSVWKGGDETMRVVRGGSWLDTADYLRSTIRNGAGPADRSKNIGFRVARSL